MVGCSQAAGRSRDHHRIEAEQQAAQSGHDCALDQVPIQPHSSSGHAKIAKAIAPRRAGAPV